MKWVVHFHHPKGNLFHYGHFIVDAVLPLALFLHQRPPGDGEEGERRLVLAYDASQHFGGLELILSKIFPGLVLEYLPAGKRVEDHARETGEQVHGIEGYAFGPYPSLALDAIDAFLSSSSSSPLPVQDLVLCIERGFRPVELPPCFSYPRNNTGARRRVLHNHGEVVAVLHAWASQHGLDFQNVQLEHMTWEDQLSLFRRARVVFGQHGAGLCNIVFCAPTKSTVVLEASHWGIPTIRNLAEARGLSWVQVPSSMSHCNPRTLECILKRL